MHNKLLLQTFEDCQYFDEPIDNSSQIHKKFTLPRSIYSYYSKIASNSESSYLLTENTIT